jgi:uncharacterized protein YgfB (UPF0149 family)
MYYEEVVLTHIENNALKRVFMAFSTRYLTQCYLLGQSEFLGIQNKAWENIVAEFNAQNLHVPREWTQLRTLYEHTKHDAKKEKSFDRVSFSLYQKVHNKEFLIFNIDASLFDWRWKKNRKNEPYCRKNTWYN